MALPDTPRKDPAGASSVPDLVTDYRTQLDALRAQARDLVHMRADVLSAAERESQAIVAAARRDVRDIIVNARRELLVLAAQIQAVIGRTGSEGGPAGPLPLIDPAELDALAVSDAERAAAPSDARQEVRDVLSEARPQLERLADEAQLLRSSLLLLHKPEPGRATADVIDPSPAPEPALPDEEPEPAGDIGGFPREPRAWRPRAPRLVASLAAVLILALIGATWLWISGPGPAAPDPAAGEAARSDASPPAPDTRPADLPPPPPAAAPDPAPDPAFTTPTLTIEARRASWIRAQIDGQPDSGRIFEPGETRRIVGAGRVVIRAGDAGAVFVSVNGAEPQAVGLDGQPRTREYVLDERARLATTPDPAVPELTTPPPGAPARPAENAIVVPSAPPPAAAPRATPPAPGLPAQASPPPPAAASNPSPGPPAAPPAASPSQDDELVELSRRWLDAYLNGLTASMGVIAGGSPAIRDDRPLQDRLASGLATTKRSFEVISVLNFAGTGTVSLRVIERTQPTGGPPQDRAALAAQTWMRRDGKWQLLDVRLVSESQVKTP
jgi:hypothetical protein